MASILTEVYVSIDGLNFTKLDLHKDESILLKLNKKDLQDISKVFAPFSQNFTIPATSKNKKAFGFFGDTQIVKINKDNIFRCKIYLNGVLSQNGNLKIESVKYKNGKAEDYSASFNTTFLSLKDRIGDDTLNDLTDLDYSINWTPRTVFLGLQGLTGITRNQLQIRYFIPLASNKRVWNFNDDDFNDNLFFETTNSPSSDRCINIGEVRPAVDFISIIDLIKKKYNLSVDFSQQSVDKLKDLFMHCNNENFNFQGASRFVLLKPFVSQSNTIFAQSNIVDSSILLKKSNTTRRIKIQINLIDTLIGDNLDSGTITFSVFNKNTGFLLVEREFELRNGNVDYDLWVSKFSFVGNELPIFINVKTSVSCYFKYSDIAVTFFELSGFFISQMSSNFNFEESQTARINLIKTLPQMSVLDFLTSLFKTFNYSIYDVSPLNEDLFILNPNDINEPNKPYSKVERDYTSFSDSKEVLKSVNNQYNSYNFKHKTSNYKSNLDFKNQFGLEFGQTVFNQITENEKKNEFKIETEFSIVPSVLLNGTQNIITFYGFTNETPEVIDNQFYRYKPNNNEPTIFFKGQPTTLLVSEQLACQNLNSSNNIILDKITNYVPVRNFSLTSETISFSILVELGVTYNETLFKIYYQKFIERLLNPNTLLQSYKMNLPNREILVNETNNEITPIGFRLQNDIIIGETRFEIMEAEIDLTTGATKTKLLNY